ncbi:hypothetical protein Vqi01_37920 [Micromonospora qiuiae]|uniref:Lycopene cyclase domain-containing protein n=1 Tax=Micromonospora qiuiae TaxID=502268 RepID=A0ABQ4JEP6_9ACTN|nr:hypothetical protein [Micromonospora qiuiae]GIJ28630.1 hypothetical protein Vqi01_37920 [Micromonospora qiuiae]
MRFRSLLLSAAGTLAAAHVVGVLTDAPILRQAEVAALVLLLAYALLAGPPSPRWAVPVALAVLVVDAVRTMPPDPAPGYHWQVFRYEPLDLSGEFRAGLELTWAALVFVLVLALMAWRCAGRTSAAANAGGPSRRVQVGAVLAGGLVVSYAAIRLLHRHRNARPSWAGGLSDTELDAAVLVPPLALVLGAIALAAMLIGQGRRLAACGAGLLALAAMFHLDAAMALGPRWLSSYPADPGVVFTEVFVFTPTLATVPALTSAAELAGYLLVVAGLRVAAGGGAQPGESEAGPTAGQGSEHAG